MAASAIFDNPPREVIERFASWPERALADSRDAPDWKKLGMRRPCDGWTHRPTKDPRTGEKTWYDVSDVYGLREEGASWHTHFLPLYPRGTAAEVMMRDYLLDIKGLWCGFTYASTCLAWNVVDPTMNRAAYERAVLDYSRQIWDCFADVPGVPQNRHIDPILHKFLVLNPHRPASIKEDMLAAMKDTGSEEQRSWFKIAVDTIFESRD